MNIQCLDCGHELTETAKFCPKCGLKVDVTWSSEESPVAEAPVDEFADQRAALEQDAQQLDLSERQNEINARDRQLLNEDHLDGVRAKNEREVQSQQIEEELKLRSEEELKDVKHQATLSDVERQKQIQDATRTSENQQQDEEAARRHQQKVRTLRAKRIQLSEQEKLLNEKQAAEHQLDDQKRQHNLQAVEEVQQAELRQEDLKHQQSLKQEGVSFDEKARQVKVSAQQAAEQEQQEADLAMRLMREHQQVKSKSADDDVDRGLRQQQVEEEVRASRVQTDHTLEMERLEKLNTLGSEALIASASVEQAKLLTSLKETEALRGLTEEQILARAASNSPEVAKAFAEKFRSAGSGEATAQMEKFYERMLDQGQQANQDLKNVQADHAKTLENLLSTAMNTGRDVDVARVQSRGNHPASDAGESTDAPCPQCTESSPDGSRFCGKCGFRLK